MDINILLITSSHSSEYENYDMSKYVMERNNCNMLCNVNMLINHLFKKVLTSNRLKNILKQVWFRFGFINHQTANGFTTLLCYKQFRVISVNIDGSHSQTMRLEGLKNTPQTMKKNAVIHSQNNGKGLVIKKRQNIIK